MGEARDPDFRVVFRGTPGLYLLLDRDFRIVEATETWLRHLDTTRDAVLGRDLFAVLAEGADDCRAPGPIELKVSLERVLAFARADAMPVCRFDIGARDGTRSERHWTILNAPILDADGKTDRIVHRVRDVTELIRLRQEGAERDELARDQQLLINRLRDANAELARYARSLGENERRLAIALQAGRLGSWEMTLPDRSMISSAFHKGCYGRGSDEPFNHDDLRAAVHPEDRQRRFVALERAFADGTDYDIEYRVVWPDGSVHWVQVRGQVIARWADGSPWRMLGVCHDITDQKRLEEQLEARVTARTQQLAETNARLTAAIAERDEAERALARAQRLEAIGQLTGGVAHDFNNLLAAIVGNLELLSGKLAEPALRRHVDAALAAAWRGGRLTQQLLAYARQQRMVTASVDVNRLLAGMDGLLRHTLGGLVRVEICHDAALWPASTDAAQLELVLLNLAINARDAMPDGGRLSIATRNLGPGEERPDELEAVDYVVITVADTGAGMTPEVLERACEPFFTTKEVGKGSGLGLAQAYGFARQSGGTVRLTSALGAGTTVEVFLRRAGAPVQLERLGAARAVPATVARGAAVLLMDDEPGIRTVTADLLSKAGLDVREAGSAEQALRLLREHRFDVAVVDYGMAAMSGREFARVARKLQPDLAVLFITGNSQAMSTQLPQDGLLVLSKPVSHDDLLHAVSTVVPAAVHDAIA